MSAPAVTFIVGECLAKLSHIPDDSVDLVIFSPPFLALREYLPDGDPNKHLEIGREATPGEFIDALLPILAELRRVLAPHGSIAIECGDTYSGSGGAGGDYNEGGLRDGQPKFKSQRKDGSWAESNQRRDKTNPTNGAGQPKHRRYKSDHSYDGGPIRDRKADEADGIVPARVHSRKQQDGWPLDKCLALVPELLRIAMAYGFNALTGTATEPWRVRNVVRWCRPNPPVGALSDKVRPATTDIVIACTEREARDRYFDHIRAENPRADETYGRRLNQGHADFHTGDKTEALVNPIGAPLQDHWWFDEDEADEIEAMVADALSQDSWLVSSQPYKGSHYATWPEEIADRLIRLMCPALVCAECNKPSQRITQAVNEPNRNTNGPQSAERKHMAGGSAGYDKRTAAESVTIGWSNCGCGGAEATTWSLANRKQWRAAGKPRWPAVYIGCGRIGWLGPDCWVKVGDALAVPRSGVVLDPFCGTGTTLAVAQGLGRSAIGIDLDARNVELAQQRVGMFLEVIDVR